MTENEDQQMSQSPNEQQDSTSHEAHPIATGLGAVSGGVIGTALGRSINKNIGAAVGGVVGGIAGGIAGNAVAEISETVIAQIAQGQPSGMGVGADNKPVELPRHYSWDELQALSKPQGGRS